jgi:Phasin protein
MRKLRLKPPANDRRPVRRSLVELTEAASRAADGGVVMMPSSLLMISPDIMPRLDEAAPAPARKAVPRKAAPRVAKAAAEPPPRAAALPQSGNAAEMLAQIAKDQQARALDNIRLGFAAALDYAKDLSRTPIPADRDPPPDKAKTEGNRTENNKTKANPLAGAAAEYRAEAVELASANLAATLDYARELVGVRTGAEFVALSSALARKQCELMLKQAAVLQSFARKATKPDETLENG